MINFFRKIRKKLADDNKPLKYARYAIGEIVLVVVGILIALSINNWNDERKTKLSDELQREENIRELYTEMQSNILELKHYNDQMQNTKEAAEYLLKSIENDSLKIENTPNYMGAVIKVFSGGNERRNKSFSAVNVRRNTFYNEIRISGNLGKIRDDSLLALLEEFYSNYSSIETTSTSYVSALIELSDFLTRNTPLKEKYNFYNNNTYSFELIKILYAQERFIKILRRLFSLSMQSRDIILPLKEKAQIIINYMDEAYPDILEKEQPTISYDQLL